MTNDHRSACKLIIMPLPSCSCMLDIRCNTSPTTRRKVSDNGYRYLSRMIISDNPFSHLVHVPFPRIDFIRTILVRLFKLLNSGLPLEGTDPLINRVKLHVTLSPLSIYQLRAVESSNPSLVL
ncbi:Uncharacterized protein TCM_044968 [Theobroma cacao]|uniref:Uncharacterized protein n=1 Tax=Theobroma cacao TaxID=3641 RepID=A0A061FRN0_THECC|nr:Uncharacterized protein TCM_044968 [Theobroma cacao]